MRKLVPKCKNCPYLRVNHAPFLHRYNLYDTRACGLIEYDTWNGGRWIYPSDYHSTSPKWCLLRSNPNACRLSRSEYIKIYGDHRLGK